MKLAKIIQDSHSLNRKENSILRDYATARAKILQVEE